METSNTLVSMVNGVDLSDMNSAVLAAGGLMLGAAVALMGIRRVIRMFKG